MLLADAFVDVCDAAENVLLAPIGLIVNQIFGDLRG